MSGRIIAPIQALRGIAASMVVLWHASRYLAPNGGGAVAQFLQGDEQDLAELHGGLL